jgi:hypothetical protein
MTSRHALSLLILLPVFVGCATTTVSFLDAPAQPAATGEAHIWIDGNENAAVSLVFEHLAKPAHLSPPKTHYLLWAENPLGRTTLLGKLQVTKKLSAEWQGTVPFEQFRIIVSAEDSVTPTEPSSPFALVTSYFEPK